MGEKKNVFLYYAACGRFILLPFCPLSCATPLNSVKALRYHRCENKKKRSLFLMFVCFVGFAGVHSRVVNVEPRKEKRPNT